MMRSGRINHINRPLEYGDIKVGTKTLEDAVLDLGWLKKNYRHFGDKRIIFKAMAERNLPLMREISNFFYRTNGIYARVCDYFAFLYRYDWYIEPEKKFDTTVPDKKLLGDFYSILSFLDNSHIKKVCGDIALSTIVNGAYYGYIFPNADGLVVQELPINYCRSRYFVGDMPAIEFNMRFFDEYFTDPEYRIRVLKMFPEDFQKGYVLYKTGKLPRDYLGDPFGSWYLLDPQSSVKFCFKNGDQPLFINAIPAILDLDAAQDLDRRKQMQQLLKILIQKLPLDKNGDLIFDVDEARDIHNNAVEMLRRAIGVDVLTTFADVNVEDMADKNTTTTRDDLEKVERSLYNALGVSRNLFNTDGNLSLEKSILDDESTMRTLLFQFNIFYDKVTSKLSKNKNKYTYHLYFLETTQYNYKELSKQYKEMVQLGQSMMLPLVALGHSQSSILFAAMFEKDVLKLNELMIPPLMSSTMNPDAILGQKGQMTTNKSQNPVGGTNKSSTQTTATKTTGTGQAGRPAKADSQKAEKTIQNKESQS